MQLLPLAVALFSLKQAIAAPIVITRSHTAEAVTVTDTYTTVTNTQTAPAVEILVSDGVTYTFTLTDSPYTEATTFTSYVNKAATTAAATILDVDTTADGATDATVEATTTTLQQSTAVEASTTSPTQGTTTTLEQITSVGDVTAAADPATSVADVQETTLTSTSTSATAALTVATFSTRSATTTLQAPTTIATAIATGAGSATVTSTSSTSTTSSAQSTSTSGSLPRPDTIVYSPYNDDSSCKDSDTVKSDLELISSTGITKIRVYGTDCNSINTVLPNAATLGLTVNQGFWIGSSGVDSIDDAVADLISYAQTNGWGVFDFITVGNEAIQAGYATVSELTSKISSVRSSLESAGYTGQITTSEPPVTFESYPELCNAEIDFVGINPHAYFDVYSSAEDAGTFVKGQVAIVKALEYCSEKKIYVTETGYPSAGIQNGGNIPSLANQEIAIAAILSEMDADITILSTYNDYWKDPGSYGIEQSFGALHLFE